MNWYFLYHILLMSYCEQSVSLQSPSCVINKKAIFSKVAIQAKRRFISGIRVFERRINIRYVR